MSASRTQPPTTYASKPAPFRRSMSSTTSLGTRSSTFGSLTSGLSARRAIGGALLLTEVGLPHHLVGAQPLRAIGEDDLAGLQDVAAIRDGEGHGRVLLDEQDRGALLVDVADDLEDRLHQDRCEPHRRLVEEHDLRPRHQRAPDREHLLLAARKRPALLVQAFLQAREEAEDALLVLLDALHVVSRERAHLQVLADGHARKDAPALGRVRDAEPDDLVRRELREVLAAERQLPGAWPQHAGDRAKRGGLARAVAADERHDLALLDAEGHALERVDVAVVGVDVRELEKRGGTVRAAHAVFARPR